jgi:hypothetical protein
MKEEIVFIDMCPIRGCEEFTLSEKELNEVLR